MRSQVLGRLVPLVVSTLLVLLLLEAGVRLLLPEALWRYRNGTFDWQTDSELGWANRPDLDITTRIGGSLVRFRTNHDGLIPFEARRERVPGTLRIMVFGDSMVVGRDLPLEEGYTARLAALLGRRGARVEVINAGVLGYSTDQVLLAMQRWLPVYRPDVALYGSTLNDFGGNVLARANAQAKPRFRLENGGRLEFVPPEQAEEIAPLGSGPRVWIQYSALYRALQPRLVVLRARLGGFDERLLLGDYQELYFDPAAAEGLDWRLYGALIRNMQRVAEENGARFFVFAHPEVGEVWEPFIEVVCRRVGIARSAYDPFAVSRRIAAVATAVKVPFLPVMDRFLAQPERGPFHLLPHDAHLSAQGHLLLAEALADALVERVPALSQASGSAPGEAL